MADPWSHLRHDTFAIAAAIGGERLPANVASCPQCGGLHRDLLAIQTALRHAWTPRRHREMQITTTDAARLRGSPWRRFIDVIGSSRDVVTRPLAVGLTSLGIAGVVMTTSTIGFADVASGTPPPEMAMDVTGAPGGTPGDTRVDREQAPPSPMLVVSIASLTAGGGLFVLRRVAGRAGRMR